MLTAEGLEFVTVRQLATLTTLRREGTAHVTPVGFTWDGDAGLVRVICSGGSQKARNAARDPRVAVCQVDGRFWLTFEGHATVSDEPDRVAAAVERYAARYRQPRENPQRVVIEVEVGRLLGTTSFRT
ncbi:pyridoxamine 5'-phosphate oxidase family protein [Jatrophihabitans fulvus]